MDIHPIRTEHDYLSALKTVERYFDIEPDPASEAGEHFEVLLALIQVYEARHHPAEPGVRGAVATPAADAGDDSVIPQTVTPQQGMPTQA